MSFTAGEKALFIFLAIAGYIFSIIDSLFFGYYLWLYFGPQFFLLYFFSSVPFVFINRANNYSEIYTDICKIKFAEILAKMADSPWATIAQIACFLILGYFTYNLYIVYYGSWVIQILKLLRNKMGFSGMEWVRILVFISLIPESLSFCISLFNNIKEFIYEISIDIKKVGLELITKNLSYIIVTIIAMAGAIVSAQIAASYIMLTYQHYLMEFYKVSVPVIRNKIIILAMLFLDIFFTIKQFLSSLYREYNEQDLNKLKQNYYSYIMLFATIYMRAISKIVLAVGIATSPWHINIKVSTFLQSMFDDFMNINNSTNGYAKIIITRLAICFSLLNLCFYIALICSGHAQISLAYKVISISLALILSFAIPSAIYNTSNSVVSNDEKQHASSDSFEGKMPSAMPEIGEAMKMSIRTLLHVR